jgi:hypothetical protein
MAKLLVLYSKPANPAAFEVVGEPEALKFDAKGTLYPMLAKQHEAAHV